MAVSYQKIWKISFPIFLSLLAQHIIIVVDTAFLGRVGEIELGASAIGGIFYVCLFILGFGFATGTQILIARRNGEKNYGSIGRYVDHTVYFLLTLALVLILFTRFFSSDVLGTILSSENIFLESKKYIDIRIWGLVFAFMNMVFRAFYIGIQKTKYLIYSASIMALVNISLDYILIFGKLGFEPMGIEGAALASVISEMTSVFFFLVITLASIDLKKYKLFFFRKVNIAVIRTIMDVAFFVMLQYLVSIISWFTFFMIIEQTGERPLAVSNIIRGLYMIFTIPIFSLGSATNTIVSNTIGENRIKDVLPTILRISKISFFTILVFIGLSLVFSRFMLSLYTNDPVLIDASYGPFYVILGVLVFFSVSIIVFNGVAGTANTRISLVIETVSISVYLVFAYYLALVAEASTATIWMSEFLYFGLLGLLSTMYLLKGNWTQKKI